MIVFESEHPEILLGVYFQNLVFGGIGNFYTAKLKFSKPVRKNTIWCLSGFDVTVFFQQNMG
jgi:hypothetical protein